MTRGKVNLTLIENPASRKATFKKRKAGLLKKVKELSTLCDVEACAVIYGEGEDEPEVWPSPDMATQLLLRFQNVPEMERCRKMVNQENYMRERTTKIQEQVQKQHKMNNEMDLNILMHHIYDEGKSLFDFDVSEVMRLVGYMDEKVKEVRKRVDHFEQPTGPNAPPPPESGVVDEFDAWKNRDDGQMDSTEQLWFLGHEKNGGKTSNIMSDMEPPPLPYFGDFDMVLPQENYGSDLGYLYGTAIEVPFEGEDMVLGYANFDGLLKNNQKRSCGGNNDEADMGNFDSNFAGKVHIDNGRSGNCASSGEGSNIGVPPGISGGGDCGAA